MEFVVNCPDEPRVLLGNGTAAQRMETSCRGASQVCCWQTVPESKTKTPERNPSMFGNAAETAARGAARLPVARDTHNQHDQLQFQLVCMQLFSSLTLAL